MNKIKINSIKKFLLTKKCENIAYFDLKNENFIYSECIIANCLNQRHLKAVSDELEDFLLEKKIKMHHIEGRKNSSWIILDCYELIIHLFIESERTRIDLDTLFNFKSE